MSIYRERLSHDPWAPNNKSIRYRDLNFIDCYHKILSSEIDIPSADYDKAIEEKAELLSSLMGRYLAEQHGDALDFSYLLRPFYYFYLFVYANGSYIKPAGTSSGDSFQPFPNLNKLSGLLPDSRAHEILYNLSRTEDPLRDALNVLEEIPRYQKTTGTVSTEDRDEEDIEPHVGMSLSLVVAEKLILWLMSGRTLRFVKARRPDQDHPPTMDPALRSRLLVAISNDTGIRQLPGEDYRLLLSSVLFMPPYFLEDFAHELAAARELSRGLSALICGIEFQHKPQVAIALALLKKRGSRLIGSQHGGAYGQTDMTLMERSERFLFDDYITWGYRFYANDHPLPSIRLSRFRLAPLWQKFRHRLVKPEAKTILVVLPNISFALACGAHHPNLLQQHEALLRSLEILLPAINDDYKIVLRMHPWNVDQDYEMAIPDFMRGHASLVHGKRGTLARDMHHFEFVMFPSPYATGLSECIVNGVPFTIISTPEFSRIRPEAEPVYRALREADVWVTEAEQLARVLGAKKINDRQKTALEQFGRMYAFHSYAYLGYWSRFIDGLRSKRTWEV